jgi:hypothetical protein
MNEVAKAEMDLFQQLLTVFETSAVHLIAARISLFSSVDSRITDVLCSVANYVSFMA